MVKVIERHCEAAASFLKTSQVNMVGRYLSGIARTSAAGEDISSLPFCS